MAKFFNKVVTPLVKASAQSAAFAANDLVFDWAAFDIPRGGAKLIGVSTVVKAHRRADIVTFPSYVFAKDDGTGAPTSLGTPNAAVTTGQSSYHQVLGYVDTAKLELTSFDAAVTCVNTAIAFNIGVQLNMYYKTTPVETCLVFDSDPYTGANVGFDRYYIASFAPVSGFLLRSAVKFDDDVTIATNNGTITTLDGDAANLSFQQGDLIHATDDIILGEIDTVDADNITFRFDGGTSKNQAVLTGTAEYTIPADIAAWRIQNGAGTAGDLANNEPLFNVHPLRITLHFEN